MSILDKMNTPEFDKNCKVCDFFDSCFKHLRAIIITKGDDIFGQIVAKWSKTGMMSCTIAARFWVKSPDGGFDVIAEKVRKGGYGYDKFGEGVAEIFVKCQKRLERGGLKFDSKAIYKGFYDCWQKELYNNGLSVFMLG